MIASNAVGHGKVNVRVDSSMHKIPRDRRLVNQTGMTVSERDAQIKNDLNPLNRSNDLTWRFMNGYQMAMITIPAHAI